MSGKGSRQRPGQGYAEGWDAIFGKKEPEMKCKCTFAQFMLGSGCDVCNAEEAALIENALKDVKED